MADGMLSPDGFTITITVPIRLRRQPGRKMLIAPQNECEWVPRPRIGEHARQSACPCSVLEATDGRWSLRYDDRAGGSRERRSVLHGQNPAAHLARAGHR